MADLTTTLNKTDDNGSSGTDFKELENIENSVEVPSDQINIDQINKPIDTETGEDPVFTQEDAVEEFLAGESKDELLICNFTNDNLDDSQDIEFKSENTLDCADFGAKDSENITIIPQKILKTKRKPSQRNSIANHIKRRSIKCLLKRHAMEVQQAPKNNQLKAVSDSPPAIQEDTSLLFPKENKSEEDEHNNEDWQDRKVSSEDSTDEYASKKDPTTYFPNDDIIENGTCSNEEFTDRTNEDPNDRNNEEEEDKGTPETHNGTDLPSTNGKLNKRKKEDEESSVKKLRSEVQQSYVVRNKIFSDLIDSPACKTVDQIQARIERIILEIRTLNEIAFEKEREWNSIIHLRKLKEELLLRMQRRKQVILYNNRDLTDSERGDISFEPNQGSRSPQQVASKNNVNYNGENNKQIDVDKNRQQNSLGILANYVDMNGHSNDMRQLKQRPVIDVQTIIADYRQRHPETVPRRGRRIRSHLGSQQNDVGGTRMNQTGTMNFASIALGSGSHVKHNMSSKSDVTNELGMFFSALENSKQNGSKLGHFPNSDNQSNSDEPSFKDVLMQFAKLSQNERCELIQNALKPPPPYPEVTVHPVPVTPSPSQKNSLLHGILTQQAQPKPENKPTFSPTLARLLTAPERSVASTMAASNATTNPNPNPLLNNNNSVGNVSISDILSHNKARHEITITPVGAQYELSNKPKNTSQMDDDEAEDSADRLVIDEGEGGDRNRNDNSSDTGDEVPQCQGCNQQPAQFVCAGCGNQWYCSRDCQVSAWDEHSEVCSG